MNREIYEQMAEGLATQLADILSAATYDQKDEFIDRMDALMMDTSSEKAIEELSDLILEIYSARLDDDSDVAMGPASILELNLGNPLRRGEDEVEIEELEIGEDDFLFSL